jgi:hypothetical protein
MDEIDRTERMIIKALQESGSWMDQKQIRKATGLPMSRVENFTLTMAIDEKIDRRLSDNHETQLFRALR